jgi:hypothetical protein
MGTFFASYPSLTAAANPSVGPNGQPIPGEATLVAGENPTGNLEPLQTDSSGNLLVSLAAEPGAPLAVNLTEVSGSAVTLGQKVSASSIPVVIASDDTVAISATVLPLPTGAATSTNQATEITALQAIEANQTNATQKSQIVDGSGNVIASTTNSLNVHVSNPSSSQAIAGTASANTPVYNVYSSTNITTSAYVQLVASTSNAINTIHIFDSSGQAMILGVGASGVEVVQLYVPPGGDTYTLNIPVGSRIAYKALTATASTGYLLMSFLE